MMLEIDGWENNIKFSAAHFITKHSKCYRIHGHDYVVSVRIYGEKKDNVIIDFSEIKSIVREIASEFDHKLLVGKRFVERTEEKIIVVYDNIRIEIRDPSMISILPIEETTVENLAELICYKLTSKISHYTNIKRVEVKVEEGRGQGASFSIDLK